MYSSAVDYLPDHLKLDAIDATLDAVLPKGSQYAYIVHDKDVWTAEDESLNPKYIAGTPKLNHLHISVYLPNSKTVSAMAKTLGVPENMIQAFKDPKGKRGAAKKNLFAYLVHLTEGSKYDGKHEYRYEDVHSNVDYSSFVDGVKNAILSSSLSKDTIREWILAGKLRFIDFITNDVYSAFYLNNKQFVEHCIDVRYKRLMNMQKNTEKVEVIYIEGAPGSGKTTYAMRYAEEMYGDYCVSSEKNDIVQDYLGQNVMIFDDARPQDKEASSWLKILDPYNNQSSVASRFYNKYLAVRCIIVTSVVPFEEFFVYCKNKSGVTEPVGQFMRRFTAVMKASGYDAAGQRIAHIDVYDLRECNPPIRKYIGDSQTPVDYRWQVNDVPTGSFEFIIGSSRETLDKSKVEHFKIGK